MPVRPETADSLELEKVFLAKVHDLTFSRSSCLDLSLTHVTKAQAVGEAPPIDICPSMKLTLLNGSLNHLLEPVSRFYAHEATIGELRLERFHDQLTVIGSRIGVLDLPQVAGDNSISVKLHTTEIGLLKSLNVKETAQVLLQDCTIKKFQSGANITIASRGNTMKKVKFPGTSGDGSASLVLKDGADVTLEDISGKVKVSSSCHTSPINIPIEEGAQNTSTTYQSDSKDENSSTLENSCFAPSWLIALLVISVVLNFGLLVFVFFSVKSNQCCIRKMVKKTCAEIENTCAENGQGASEPFLKSSHVKEHNTNQSLLYEKEQQIFNLKDSHKLVHEIKRKTTS